MPFLSRESASAARSILAFLSARFRDKGLRLRRAAISMGWYFGKEILEITGDYVVHLGGRVQAIMPDSATSFADVLLLKTKCRGTVQDTPESVPR